MNSDIVFWSKDLRHGWPYGSKSRSLLRRLRWLTIGTAVALLLGAADLAYGGIARAEPTCTVNPQPVGTTITVTYNGLKTSGLGPHAHYLSTLFAMDLLDELGNPLPLTYEELQTRVIVPGAAEQTVFFEDEGDGRFDAGLLLVRGDGKANGELSTHCFAIVA